MILGSFVIPAKAGIQSVTSGPAQRDEWVLSAMRGIYLLDGRPSKLRPLALFSRFCGNDVEEAA